MEYQILLECFPKGLIAWSIEIGPKNVLSQLEDLFAFYGEDRYRPNPMLSRVSRELN